MVKFFVGQRVRMVRPVNRLDMADATGRIRGFNPSASVKGIGSMSVVLVDWDSGERDGPRSLGFSGYSTLPDTIEPILPAGHRPAKQGSFELLDHLLSRLKGVEA